MRPLPKPGSIQADVLIIGAGPAGSAAAIRLGQMGIQNVILVDRHDFPRHKICGSGISPKGLEILKDLGVWDTVTREAYSIKGLRLVTPGNTEMVVSGGGEAVALICQRRILDNCLLGRALSLGTRFMPAFEARSLIFEGSRVAGAEARDGRAVHAKYTVIANGAHSRLTLPSKSKQTLQGIMGWWENVPFTPNQVEMIFDESLIPHYGWLFPESPSRVNIGICYEDPLHKKNSRTLFERFLRKYYQTRIANAVQLSSWKGYPISYSYHVGELHSPGRLIVGEAGRMAHPATGEGIYQGMLSGVLAAEALREALVDPTNEERAISAYEEGCRRAFRASFWSAKVWRGAVNSHMLDAVVSFGQKPSVKRALSKIMSLM